MSFPVTTIAMNTPVGYNNWVTVPIGYSWCNKNDHTEPFSFHNESVPPDYYDTYTKYDARYYSGQPGQPPYVPTTISANYSIYDRQQNFTTAAIYTRTIMKTITSTYTYDKQYGSIQQIQLLLWTVDQYGADIPEPYPAPYVLDVWFISGGGGSGLTVHGQKYWKNLPSPQDHLICGFRGAIRYVNTQNATMTINDPIRLIVQT